MVSFSFMHTISYLKNAPHRCKHILTVWSSAFSAGCTLQFSTLSSMLFFVIIIIFLIFGCNRRAPLQMYLTLDLFWSH